MVYLTSCTGYISPVSTCTLGLVHCDDCLWVTYIITNYVSGNLQVRVLHVFHLHVVQY